MEHEATRREERAVISNRLTNEDDEADEVE